MQADPDLAFVLDVRISASARVHVEALQRKQVAWFADGGDKWSRNCPVSD